ncbi:prolipoprotein diacylglyceryl transferase [Sneathiella sp. P13V-1]|uniref:prolipoprotein diacylglyceryl transferase n=1 Tax=Sneathiella sp. P13V-1 TaxID=2697366 RepID=UPI00187BA9DA|nr:prolipoprotein diacylglyceryl transferase [Sneathiella sp. P13V-1]MBE7638075.1 prolipoprotein diacylglyceryl transferase [Sneathiella sp. P13V-1]
METITQFAALAYPEIDPILFSIGPFAIRWYALAYIAGLIIGWRLMIHFAKAPGSAITPEQVDDFLVWATLGVVLGGRLGYVIFYKPSFYLANPGEIFMVWQGGMSFHGGFLGVVVAALLFAKRRNLPVFSLADLLAIVAPVGLFFGRVANFINGELYGRVTDVGWGMVFPGGGPEPRHPSQLYEAILEGALLFIVQMVLRNTEFGKKPGVATGVFLIGYALARGFVELFRQPDAHLGFLIGGSTMGQLLSIPMILVGAYLILRREPS